MKWNFMKRTDEIKMDNFQENPWGLKIYLQGGGENLVIAQQWWRSTKILLSSFGSPGRSKDERNHRGIHGEITTGHETREEGNKCENLFSSTKSVGQNKHECIITQEKACYPKLSLSQQTKKNTKPKISSICNFVINFSISKKSWSSYFQNFKLKSKKKRINPTFSLNSTQDVYTKEHCFYLVSILSS